jgi:regulator of protease activity HflC (stomatin/prohibitin superfamily)
MDASWDGSANKPLHIREIELPGVPGFAALVVSLLLLLLAAGALAFGAASGNVALIVLAPLLGITGFLGLIGLFTVAPNQAKVLQLFGDYRGTVKTAGLKWANPFYSKSRVTLRVRNFESEKLKVNDHSGNPIQIAAIVVWKVIDTAEAVFHVDNYENFVRIQTEAALRNLASSYPYYAHVDGEISLRSHTAEVAEHLKTEIQDRLTQAGVLVIEARISHLAYAPEIAGVMLQRQQASAVIAARSKIVEGAVGMVEMALEMLSKNNIVELDEDRKATMVSNLLIVLCGDRGTQPVVNAGTVAT